MNHGGAAASRRGAAVCGEREANEVRGDWERGEEWARGVNDFSGRLSDARKASIARARNNTQVLAPRIAQKRARQIF
jgi:hypothetical protein